MTIVGPNQPYDVTAIIDESTGFVPGKHTDKFDIQYDIQTSLIADGNEHILLEYLN